MMKQRAHCFHDFGLPYIYRIKAMSWITADYLQWTLKSLIKYMEKCIFHICNLYIVFHPLALPKYSSSYQRLL